MPATLRMDDTAFRYVAPPVSDSGAYHPVGFWQTTVPIEPGKPLSENLDCDVAIIGGGFTGMSVALELKRASPDLNVIVLERAVIGHGSSGRNAGFVVPLLGWDLPYLVRKLGPEGAKAAHALMYDAVAHVKRIVERHHIDCDLEETGYMVLGASEARRRGILREIELSDKLGFSLQYLEGEALRRFIKSERFVCGSFDPRPNLINPVKLVRGVKASAESLGARVYEQTPLVELRDGDPIVITTPHAVVRARAGVLALNGYGPSVGFKKTRSFPVHTYVVLSEPLRDADLEALGEGRRAGFVTARNYIHYFRLTPDNRVLFGGDADPLFFNGVYRDECPRIAAAAQALFYRYFPQLRHVRFVDHWGGVLSVTLNLFPQFGVEGRHKSIFYAGGYSGHGVSLSNYAGVILAPHILRRLGVQAFAPLITPFFFNRKSWPVPGGIVRYLGYQGYQALLRLQDWHEGA